MDMNNVGGPSWGGGLPDLKNLQQNVAAPENVQQKGLADLQAGDSLKAVILEVLSDTDALVGIGGKAVTAKTTFSFSGMEGQSVSLRVLGRAASGEVILKIEGEDSPALPGGSLQGTIGDLLNSFKPGGPAEALLAKLQTLLPAQGDMKLSPDLQSALEGLLVQLVKSGPGLENTLNDFISLMDQQYPEIPAMVQSLFPGIEELSGDALKEAFSQSGPFLEMKLLSLIKAEGPEKDAGFLEKDLKALLLKFRGLLEDVPARGQDRQGAGLANRLLEDVKTFQLLSRLTGSLYSFMPLKWDGLKNGQMGFKSSDSGASCLINLDLEDMGKVAVSVFMRNAGFYVTLKVEDPAFRLALAGEAGSLKEIFLAEGLSLKMVNVTEYEESVKNHLDFPGIAERLVNIRL